MKMIGKDNYQNIEKFRNYSNEVSLVDKELERTFTSGTVSNTARCHLETPSWALLMWTFAISTFLGGIWESEIKRKKVTKTLFAAKCEPSLLIARNVGNMYTPSLYGCLSSLLSSGQLKGGEHVGMFSYGSGVCSTFYTIKVNANEQFSKILRVFKDLPHRLENRTKITPGEKRHK